MKLLCHVPVVTCSIFHSILSDAGDEFKALKAPLSSTVNAEEEKTNKGEIKTLWVHMKEII